MRSSMMCIPVLSLTGSDDTESRDWRMDPGDRWVARRWYGLPFCPSLFDSCFKDVRYISKVLSDRSWVVAGRQWKEKV